MKFLLEPVVKLADVVEEDVLEEAVFQLRVVGDFPQQFTCYPHGPPEGVIV